MDTMNHNDIIYSWQAELSDGSIIRMPKDDNNVQKGESPFSLLDTTKVSVFTLVPLHSHYAPIRIHTSGEKFKYYIRWIRDLLTQKVQYAFYVVELKERVYVIKYPNVSYKIFNNIYDLNDYIMR